MNCDGIASLWPRWGPTQSGSWSDQCEAVSISAPGTETLSFENDGRDGERKRTVGRFFLAFLRRIFPRWGWWGPRECFWAEETQVLILSASAGLGWALRAPCRRGRGPSQASSPCSGAFGSRCCSLRWAGRFPRQILELQRDKGR